MGYITLLPDFPLVWNFFFGVIVAMIYVQGVIFLVERMLRKGILSSDFSRKIIHIAAGSFIWVWLFIDPTDISYILNIAIPSLFFFTFLNKGFRGSPDDKDVRTMSRTGDPRELLKGTLYFTIVMMITGSFLFGSYVGMFTMAILGWGDGLAPYIGKRWGNLKYKTLGREKSIEGSIGVFLFSIIGCLIFYLLLGVFGSIDYGSDSVLADPNAGIHKILIIILILSFIAMVIEALSPADVDNLLIPASTIITTIILDSILGTSFFVLLRAPISS